jgi:tetratricopeptide (TPR) repeat protein
MPNPQAEKIKAEGNAFFKGGQYQQAIDKYLAATAIDASVPAYWSNMAACYEKIGDYEKMADAGRSCVKADKNFVKGYFRLATALKGLDDLQGCVKALESGLAIQSSNPDLKRMKKEVTELQRGDQVAAYCRKAEEQMGNGDIAGAFKTLELASRLDAGNPDIERMMAKVKPKYEKMETARKAGLSGSEVHKEKGDEKYKAADFEGAVDEYTKCIEDLKKEGKELSPLAVKAHSNRAACYKQISNFDGVIEGKYLESQSETVFFPARSLGQSPFSSSHTELSCLFVSSLLLFAQIALPFSRSTPTTLRPSSAVRRPSRDWSATASHFRMSSKCSACPTTRSAR